MTEEGARVPREAVKNLYPVARHLSIDSREKVGLRFPVRVYVQDPEVAKRNPDLGVKNLWIDWEPGLMDGPTSARVAVVDYNADTGLLAPPARWDEGTQRFLDAEDPESFQFHQVHVWGVVQNTLAFYEDPHVMGRPIPWGFEGNRLIVVPHAGYARNAYYDRESKSLQLYFFERDGKPVYTCLSHDIISHETGHAILDGIRPYYHEISSTQTAAFHEFLADLTAILAALRNNEVRQIVAELSGGDLLQDRVIADLAEEFAHDQVVATYGEAERYYLRTAHNDLTMEDIRGEWEPHRASQVLTGAMFQILAGLTQRQLEGGRSPAEALWRATDHLNRMALRALDFCPPVGIQFIDYARAVLLADESAYPKDSLGYRDLVREVFKGRGLTDLEAPSVPYSVDFIWRYDIDGIARSRTAAYHFLNDNRKPLRIPANQDLEVLDLYFTDKVVEAEQRLPQEIVLEYAWGEDVVLEGPRFGSYQGEKVLLLSGGTLVFDGRGNVLHWSRKSGVEGFEGRDRQEGEQRRGELLDYLEQLIQAGVLGLAEGDGGAGLDVYPPAVRGRRANGALRFSMTPHLLHERGERGLGG